MPNDSKRHFKIAIIGSGPSGFYAAESLFLNHPNPQVDMFERLPTPFGLVRYGVAPDHHKIKNVIKVYEKIAADKRFRFLGNVRVGWDIGVHELKKYYDAVIFACGAEKEKRLGIPGEDLPGSHTATEFVAWYNGHPDYAQRTFDLSCSTAVIIGQGNVAIDVARILCKTPDELKNTDIAKHALEALSQSKIREIYLIGRRGPVQAAFTVSEIREMGELADCVPIIRPEDLKINPESHAELELPDNIQKKRNWNTLLQFAYHISSDVQSKRKVYFRFLKSPVSFTGTQRVESIVLEKNVLTGLAGSQKAKGTGEVFVIPCGIVFRSVGYHGVPIPEMPFDVAKGIFPNDKGRLLDNGRPMPGFYVVGWLKRGPSGIIGTNKPDSVETVKTLLDDAPNLPPCEIADGQRLSSLLSERKVRVVSFEEWKKIDGAEISRGQSSGKPREKFISINDMLQVIG